MWPRVEAIAPALAVSLAGGEFAGRAGVRESAGRMVSARGRGYSARLIWPWLPFPEEALDRWRHKPVAASWTVQWIDPEGGHLDLVGRGS